MTPQQLDAAERVARRVDSEGRSGEELTEADVRAEWPEATPDDIEVTLKDSSRRVTARIAGRTFVERLREKYGDVPPDDPRANTVETIPEDAGKGNYWFVQRHQGRVVGGAKSLFGIRGMVAGDEPIGSPVSAGPIFRAMTSNPAMRYPHMVALRKKGTPPVEAYLAKLEEMHEQAKGPRQKEAFREQIDSLRQLMSPRLSRHQDQQWVREQASKMENDFPALFGK
jgi:hypothetical protein